MNVLINDTVKELHFYCDGIDQAAEIIGNHSNLEHDRKADAVIMSQEDYDWWNEIFSKSATYDEAIENIASC